MNVEARFSDEKTTSAPIPLPSHISWKTACLRFEKTGIYDVPINYHETEQTPLYIGYLEYQDPDGNLRDANISHTTSEQKPVLFTGTNEGASAYDPLMNDSDLPFYIVRINPNELYSDMTALCKLWHELGHTIVYHTNADTQLLQAALSGNNEELPAVRMAEKYAQELRRSLSPYALHNYRKNPAPVTRAQVNDLMHLSRGRYRYTPYEILDIFQERNATAAGAHLVLRHGYPTGFQNVRSYFDYTRTGLSAHGQQFGNTAEFVKGLKR